MQCVTPMFRQYNFSTGETIRIVPREEILQNEFNYDPNYIRHSLGRLNEALRNHCEKIQTIPCGKCWACKITYSAEWATRCMLESLYHNENYFVTLTYDDEHLPIMEYIDTKLIYDHGEYISEKPYRIYNDGTWIDGCLVPADVSRFIDSLRDNMERKGYKNVRYLYCGEYGTTTGRPHYHLLLFGIHLDITENYDHHIDDNFKEHFKNATIDHLWNKGLTDISLLEWSNAAYVCRYCTKKIFEDSDIIEYAENGKVKEFIRMSRRPGIGMQYYEDHKHEIYETDSIVMKTVKGNTGNYKPPKAFDKKYKEEYPERWKEIQKRRMECAERTRKNAYYISDYTDVEKMIMAAEKIETKGNMLKREGIE